MNNLNIPAPSPRLQDWDPGTFFYILDRIDRTPLENAVAGPVAGPRRRGPKLKELNAVIGLYLWYRTCQEVRTNDRPDSDEFTPRAGGPEERSCQALRVRRRQKTACRKDAVKSFSTN